MTVSGKLARTVKVPPASTTKVSLTATGAAAWTARPNRKKERANEPKEAKPRVSAVRPMGMGTFEALPGDELLGPLRRVCRMAVRNVEFTEGEWEKRLIREERGKGKKQSA